MKKVYFKIVKECRNYYSGVYSYVLYIRDPYGLTYLGEYFSKDQMTRHIKRIQKMYYFGFSL